MRYIKIFLLIAASLTLFACGNNASTTAAVVVGTNSMSLQGGKAFSDILSTGGTGGSITINSFSDVKINPNDKVTTTFTVPTISPAFGPVHVTVSIETPVKLTPDPSIVAGDLFVNPNDLGLFQQTAGGPVQVTGLSITSSGKLTLPANFVGLGINTAAVKLADSVVIDGTLTAAGNGTNLYLETGDSTDTTSLLKVSSSGQVLTTPFAGSSSNGGSIVLVSWGMLINQGDIDSSGSGGQPAGAVDMESFGFLYNTGNATARGGSSDSGVGGNGNAINMTTFNGSLFTSGALENSGGDGFSGGGDGGQIFLSSGGGTPQTAINPAISVGKTVVGGTLTSNGGNATNSGNGGNGANYFSFVPGITFPSQGIVLESNQSGPLLVSARITSRGGAASSGAAAFTGGSGGNLVLFQGFGTDIGNQAPTEGIRLGSVINLSGGDAGSGGNGGTISISNDFALNAYPKVGKNSKTAGLPIVELVGYTGINLSGGDAGSGGNGGSFSVFTHSPKIADLVYPAPAIKSSVPITAKGGDGNTHDVNFNYRGGDGGSFNWSVGGDVTDLNNPVSAFQDKISVLDNTGAINISGGNGDSGGNCGSLFFYGYTLKNSGAISARGGKGTTLGGNGSDALIELHATLSLNNTAAITTTGGSGVTGGNGGSNVLLTSKTTTNSGGISANGGSGSVQAGSGGLIDLESHNKSTVNSGALNVAKGGGTGGQNGRIIIDLVERKVPDGGVIQ